MAPERLSALDASFLYLERPAMHMHVAALSVFDPSTRPDGRLRSEDVAAVIASRIHLAPRFRQKAMSIPWNVALPVWVDDPHFDLDFHVRRAGLPSPGGRRELTDYAQRILSRPLDRTKPLWELYVIEGLEGGHVAALLKVHHAIFDGVSGMQLAAAREALFEQLTHPVQAFVNAVDQVVRAPATTAFGLGVIATGVRSIFDMGTRPKSPLDVRIGPNRRFAMTEAPLQRFKDVKDALGGTVNDVVLTVVAGALHSLLKARKEPTRGRTLRVMVPVSVRASGEEGAGNRVAPAFVDIPVGAVSPKRRLAEVRKGTRHLKESMMAMGADAIISLGAYAPGGLLAGAARLVSRGPWFNLVVSNIPGPQQPMYLAGARLVASYPSMPLGENSALSIACSSLGGTMAFGLTGDWDGMPDILALAFAIDGSLDELCKAVGV